MFFRKNKKSGKKGFTLVELLAVLVILGIVTGLSLPLLKTIQDINKNKKFNSYSDSMKYGAKLYLNSYEMDSFGDVGSGCTKIGFTELNNKGLLKDIALDNVSCEDDATFVRVLKVNDHYGYSMHVKCTNTVTHKLEYQYPENSNDAGDCDFGNGKLIDVKPIPDHTTSYVQSVDDIVVRLESYTGIYPNDVSIEYAFSTQKNENSIIGTWNPLSFTVPNENTQYSAIENDSLPIKVDSAKFKTPEGYTGTLYLLVRVINLKDLADRNWMEDAPDMLTPPTDTFKLDVIKPTDTMTSTNNVAATQSVTLHMEDNIGLASYYFGTTVPNDSNRKTLNYKTISGKNVDKVETVSDGKTYYLRVYDIAGNYVDDSRIFYKTTLVPNRGTVNPNTVITLVNNSFNIPNPGAVTGYTWGGWFTNNNLTGTAVTSHKPTSNASLYGKWTANSYNIAYTMNGGNNPTTMPTSGVYDQNVTISKPTKTFTVNVNANNAGATISSTTASSAQTFAGWTGTNINTSTAKYGTVSNTVNTAWSNGSTKVGSNSNTMYFKNLHSNQGATVTMVANWTAVNVKLPTATRTGYTCSFNTAANGSGTSYASGANYTPSTTTNNATLYVRCTPNKYTVTLSQTNATTNGTASVQATYDAAMPTISLPKRQYTVTYNYNYTGSSNTTATATYNFGGYSYNGTNYYTSGGASARTWNIASNTTLAIAWTGGSVTLPNPSRTSYDFNGWYTAATGGTRVGLGNASYTVTKNETLYAHWTLSEFTVTLDKQGGTGGSDTVKARNGSAMTTITAPTKAGYKVTYNYNGSGQASSSATSAYTFNGYFAATGGSGRKYYNANGTSANTYDKSADSRIYAYWTGGAVTLPTPSANCGNSFAGWYTAQTGGTRVGGAGASYTPTAAVTLYAHWTSTDSGNFGSDSWATIVSNVQNGNYGRYPVGSTKTVNMGSLGCHTLRVSNNSNYGCSRASKTACGFVLEFTNVVDNRVFHSSDDNSVGWPGSTIRSYLNGTFYNALPADLRNGIISTTVVSGHGTYVSSNQTSTDKIYLLATAELKPNDYSCIALEYTSGQTRLLDYYSNHDPVKYYNGGAYAWWMRSANSCDGWRVCAFRIINGDGSHGSTCATGAAGVSPAFRLRG